ncbi:uncharacterized protein C5orf34 homolog [Tiliqua scincoides]|uniref:uncharacterized protein C5orf34 homolog n=1 Tax=Tiliqua scincoides TaxID=71010 RepID=UPI0034617B8B
MVLETFMILYEDNSVEVHYTDGSKLLLSPCGSEFLFEKAISPSAHPMQPAERIHQRTPFAISIYREQLLRAIDFRNQYSDRPYLPSGIMPPERKNIIFKDISEAEWPGPQVAGGLISMHDRSVKVSSLDGNACLCLPELQQEFTVEFLCKVSQKPLAPLPILEKSCGDSTKDWCGRSSQNLTLGPTSKQLSTEEDDNGHYRSAGTCKPVNKSESTSTRTQGDQVSWSFQCCSSEYFRITQHMSVSCFPEEWKYPFALASMFHQSRAGSSSELEGSKDGGNVGQGDVSDECKKSRMVTCLPLALPPSCCAPYLHRWNFGDFFQLRREENIGQYLHSQPIKVVWNDGVIYRFLPETSSIEIYPGDGSVFKSEGPFLGRYFTRYSIHEGTKQREEMMYSVSNLPPNMPGSVYSIHVIITQAMRILQQRLEATLSLTHNCSICCWKQSPETSGGKMPAPLAEKLIPNVGRLLAYSDNKVLAIFHDGVTLNMVWDFSSCCGKSQIPQDANTGWCKLISPEGTQQLIQIDNPGPYDRYIRTVVEWCRILDRKSYTDISQPTAEENWSVDAELEKIRRFNFLLENSNIPLVKTNPSFDTDRKNNLKEIFLAEDVSKKKIIETLEKTSKIINDIDSLLASSAK